jgi:zinc protease
MLNEIRRLVSEQVTDEDIDDNKSYFTGHLPLQLENNEGIAGTILSMECYNLGLDYLLKYRDMIYSLTKDDLLAAAQHYWNPEAFVLAVAGPDEG